MSIGRESFQKNLKINQEEQKPQNILDQQQKKNVVSSIYNDPKALLDKMNLINTQKVTTNLTEQDREYLQDIIDMDLYKEGILTFENLPQFRVAREKAILKKGPTHLKGCRNSWARTKWKSKQKSRVKKAESLLKKHKKLLDEYEQYKNAKIDEIFDDTQKMSAYNAQDGVEDISEALTRTNEKLARDAIYAISDKIAGTVKELDDIVTNYVIDADKVEEERKAAVKKSQDKRKKNEKKTGKVAADEEIIAEAEDAADEIFAPNEEVKEEIQTKVKDLDGKNPTQLKDMADLFRKVLMASDSPFVKENYEEETANVGGKQVTQYKLVSVEDLSAKRYFDIKSDAKKVLDYANDLNIPVPQELHYLIDVNDDNPFLTGAKEKFEPEKHGQEAHVLLMSAVAQVYYNALNRYAGYFASNGAKDYKFSNDMERTARNFDILNIRMMTNIRNIKDLTGAYANEIRKNREEIYSRNVPAEVIQDKTRRENAKLMEGAQPTGLKEEEKNKVNDEVQQEKIYEEWKNLLKNDIRGTVAVDSKDTKQEKWYLSQYADQVFQIMKDTPDCKNLTGEPLKRYLISINSFLGKALLQLEDELPKTSVGKKFCYVPRLRDEFIEKIKTEKFAMLLKPFFYRDLLRNNSILDDLFDKPKYTAIRNRQREIMKAINEELGIEFYTNAKHLTSLWADEEIQKLLLSEPADQKEQERLAEEQIKAKQDKNKKNALGNKGSGVIGYTVQKILANSKNYGVTDDNFKKAIEKIKANVHDNIAVIDRKMNLMGLCDTAKAMLKRGVFKRLGGEYLLGYNVIAQDIVEYTVDNMMVYDGNAAEIQRTWDRKFARTGLPSRLSQKIERVVSAKINENGKKDEYYLRPEGFKVSKACKTNWKETNNKTNDAIKGLKKLYNDHMKDLLSKTANSDEIKKVLPNYDRLFVDGQLRLSKKQWDTMETFFENLWLKEFEDVYANGDYNKEKVNKKLPKVKNEVYKAYDKLLTDNFLARQKLEGDKNAKRDFEDTLITKEEYTDGLNKNVVVEQPKTVIKDDIDKQIFGDADLKNILKKKDDRTLFLQVLGELLRDEKSFLHAKYAYLDDVRSIEQLADLNLIEYTQFFADMKANLKVMGGAVTNAEKEQYLKAKQEANKNRISKNQNNPVTEESKKYEQLKKNRNKEGSDRLLLEDWRKCGLGGSDVYGIKKKLLRDFLSGDVTNENIVEKIANYEQDALLTENYERMHIDAILASEQDEADSYLKFNYLNVVGKTVAQTARMKRLYHAEHLWKKIHDGDKIKNRKGMSPKREEKLTIFLGTILKNLEGLKSSEVVKEIKNLGKFLDTMVITNISTKGAPKWEMDEKSKEIALKSKFFAGGILTRDDIEMIKALKDYSKEINDADPSEKKLKLSDVIAEMFLFGCGKQYFEAGGAGEKVFLDSKDEPYLADIAKQGVQFYKNKELVQRALKVCDVPDDQIETITTRLRTVIAGVVESDKPEIMAKNRSRYGVVNLTDLISKLESIYDYRKPEGNINRTKSFELGQIYLKRKNAIDNYPGEGTEEQGKFRIIRDYMLKDPETWKIVMTASDDAFLEFMEKQNQKYGKLLDVLRNDNNRGSQPIMEQYLMTNWAAIEKRTDWTTEQWSKDVETFTNAFMQKKVGKKSINSILDEVQKKMVKEGMDTSVKNGTILMRLSYILGADPASFALLYNADDMFDAIKRVDKQYAENMMYFDQTMLKATLASQKNETYAEDEKTDKLYKELAMIVHQGRIVEDTKAKMSYKSVIRRVEEQSKKANVEVSDNSKIYADYNLLLQIMKPYAFTTSPEEFKKRFTEKLHEFQEARNSTRNANIYGDRNVLVAKDKVRLEIDIRKNQGKMLEKEYLSELADYREKRAALGSIGLVAYNADPKYDAKDIAGIRKFIDENLGTKYDSADAEFIKGLLTEKGLSLREKKEEDLKDFLKVEKMRLLSLDKALRESDSALTEDDIKKAIVFAFAQNANRTEHSLDGTHDGDVKEILKELNDRTNLLNFKKPVSPMAQRDYEEFMEEIDIARYTMNKTQFQEICEKKKKYFELVDAAYEKIKETTADLGTQIGLYEYLKKDIFEALKAEAKVEEFTTGIAVEIGKLIGDKVEGKYDLDAESIRKIAVNYLPNSSQTMQQYSTYTASAQEKLFTSTNYTREDMEKEIALSGKKDLVKLYNSLSVEEQKVFAIALTFPDIGLTEKEQLASNVALRDKQKEYQKELELQEQLAAFIYDKDFMPKIDYNVVMRRLVKTDRKTGLRRVSQTMFEKAMKYTMFCVSKKNELRPKDFDKLSDGVLTGTLGRLFATNQEDVSEAEELQANKDIQADLETKTYYGPKTFKEFFQKYAKSDGAQDKKVKAIFEKFNKYNDVQMYMLLHVLQDRTAVDYTTSDGKFSALMLRGVAHVNTQRRENIKYSFMKPDGMDHKFIAELNRSMTHSIYDKAAETLFSYQLRDDVDLTNKAITRNDFAKGALDRTTQVDWKLLERAMSLVEEIEGDNLHIQLCRQTVEHTTDNTAINEKARTLGHEINDVFREEVTNHFDYFIDMLVREAKKDPDTAMPLISAFSGLSMNEKMLLVHALKHRDILDVSSDGAFTTAIGMNENKYVNELGRDQLADYYVDHFGVAGAKNIMATSQYDVRDALKSLVSTKVSDSRDPETKKTYAALLEGKTVFNWKHIGSRSTGVDWELFANALKFVKRTEEERQLLVGHAERYRSAGDIDKYGRFKYNFQYMRKNLYRSGFRLTRFMGRRIRAELEAAIPGYGVGQRIMMACLSPEMRNKMLSTGIVKPGISKGIITDSLGYAGIGGSTVSGVGSVLKMVESAGAMGTAIAGEAITQSASALKGIYNIGINAYNIKNANKPIENEEELRKESNKKAAQAKNFQTEVQQLVSKNDKERTQWILDKVGGGTVVDANRQQIVETLTECVNVLSGSSFGIKCITSYFAKGIQIAVQEALHTARFIISVCQDKKMMDKYFANEGPLGQEIANLRSANLQNIKTDQSNRRTTGSRHILDDADLGEKELGSLKNMSNTELFRKAYGFKDFSEQASYVGWNIVQTLLSSASPFGADPLQFMKASVLLTALGCKDAIGKQDNDTAQFVYNKLMGKDIR